MRILILIFISAVVCANISAQTSPPAPTPPASPGSPDATKLNAEVVKLFQQKKYDEALTAAQKALATIEKELGKNHPAVAQAWRNLAFVQQRREKPSEAQQGFENALDIYEKNQPLSTDDQKRYIELLGIVATYQANDGRLDKATEKLHRAVELSEKANGKDDLETGDQLLRLAQIYQIKLDYDKAVPLFLRALDIKNRKLGTTNDETQFVYRNTTCILRKSGQEEQIKLLRETYDPPKNETDSAASKTPKIINGGVINGKALELAKPAYPAEAREKRASDAVMVEVTINEKRQIIFACAFKGAKELQRASEAAAYNSRFAPTTLGGQPVRVQGVIVYNFVP